jgi:Ferritin-like domain
MTALQNTTASLASRRRFISLAGVATAAAIGASQTTGAAQALTDFDILNFALNLEYLEAEYYLRAAFGRGLADADITGTGNLGQVVGGTKVTFASDAIRQYAKEIAADEEAHVKFIRAALTAFGGAPVARPTIDLQQSFTAAAVAAGLIPAGGTFNPFADENSFLLGAFVFEDVGVTAYKGAARLLMNKDVLEAAAGLLGTEAYHAATVRTVLFGRGLITQAKKISDLRDAVDGSTDLDQGISLGGVANIVPTDANALAFSRTAGQVLNIVYLGGASGNFGFFPDRLNGTIR